MTFPPYAKALIAAIAGAVVPPAASATVAAVTSSAGPSGTTSLTESIAGLVVSGLLTYFVPNGKSVKASGYNIALQLNPQAFMASVETDTPEMLARAVKAALGQPAEAPVEVKGSTDVTGTLTSGPTDPSAPVTGTGV